MGAVRLLVRSKIRRHWRSLIVVALLVGFTGAATLAAVAGARRTSTSFDRFRESARDHDLLVIAEGISRADVAKLRSLPGVETIGHVRQYLLARADGELLDVGGAADDVMFRDVDRFRIVDGRAPDPAVPEEVVVPEPLARQTGLRVGETVPVRAFSPEQLRDVSSDSGDLPVPAGPTVRLRVVGIARLPIDLSLQSEQGGNLVVQRSFVERYGSRIGIFSDERGAVLFVRLRDGIRGIDRFVGQLDGVLGKGEQYDVDPTAVSVGGVQDSIDLLAIGILTFGVVAGVAGLIALGLVISRQVALVAAGQSTVRDLGMERQRRATVLALPLLLAVAVGVVAAVVGAWLVSPLMPFGVAGRAEPDPGMRWDATTLGLGALVMVVVLTTITAVVAWRATRPDWSLDPVHRRPSVVTRSLATIGLGPPVTIGVGMALQPGRGRTAVPVRSSLVGASVAVLGVVAVAVFGASLDHLVESPRARGVGWQYLVNDTGMSIPGIETDGKFCGPGTTRWTNYPTVEAAAIICTLSIRLDGRAVGAVSFRPLRGEIEPTVLEGRAPRTRDEVAVGSKTLDTLGVEIGDRVTGQSPAGTFEYRIVGRVVIPTLVDPQSIADGAVFTGAGLARLESENNASVSVAPVVRFRPEVDVARAKRQIARLDDVGEPSFLSPGTPLEVERVQQIDRVPLAVAGFLTVLGAIAVGHLLVVSVQRRGHDLAVLKTLGFSRRQTYATIGAQVTTVAAVGVAVGLVLGVAAGSYLWRAAAAKVGVLAEVSIPALGLAGIAVATFVIALLVAVLPARSAARTPPATLLRSD